MYYIEKVIEMGLMLYNSLTNKIEEFKTQTPGVVNMYVCGPTVYNYIHIGNARPVIFYDMLKNYLTYIGYKVNYASNITDVDDKIINKAIAEGVSEKEIATRYENAYFKNCAQLNSKRPDFVPHATEYITNMVSFINDLITRDYAYDIDGDVYFRVNKLDNYGILSNQVTSDLQEGARVDVSTKKESPLDFSLWKKTDTGIKWNSPFGDGRPGWHTECVCMIDRIFNGKLIDIHGGGMDLKFPHHENEIAQSMALRHNTLAAYWMHVGRLDIQSKNHDGFEKMSKSLGNTILVEDFKTKRDLMTLRLLIVTQPYRNSINYSEDLFNQYGTEYDRIVRSYHQASVLLDYNGVISSDIDEADKNEFIGYMNQDLNCQNAMTVVSRLIKEMNTSMRSKDYTKLAMKTNMLKQIMDIFGIELTYNKLSDEDRETYRLWEECKRDKNFEKADEYRNILMNKGII